MQHPQSCRSTTEPGVGYDAVGIAKLFTCLRDCRHCELPTSDIRAFRNQELRKASIPEAHCFVVLIGDQHLDEGNEVVGDFEEPAFFS